MASTTTTTCDRCGSVIVRSGANEEEEPVLRGYVQLSSSRRWEDQHRVTWDLCGACYDTALGRIRDILGQPHDEWTRPEGELEEEV